MKENYFQPQMSYIEWSFIHIKGGIHIPGQGCSPQLVQPQEEIPLQPFPPNGKGEAQFRVLALFPPHVTLHAPSGLQADHPPSTAKE